MNWTRTVSPLKYVAAVEVYITSGRVDTKWHFQFIAKYDYCFLWDVIIAIIATVVALAIIATSQLL
jgi:hypothetical protein